MTRPGCEGCELRVARRDFLRDAAAALAALAALGIAPHRLHALSVSVARGLPVGAEKAYPLPPADGVQIDSDESVIIARFDGHVWAFSLACPHQNTAVRWDASARRFQCPKHKSRYRPDGTFIQGRATRGLDRFAVRRDGDRLLVNLDALFRQDEDGAQWASAVVLL